MALLSREEQRKRKISILKIQLDYILARNIPQSDIRKSSAVWDVDTAGTIVCVALSSGDFNQEKCLTRKPRRQLQQDRDNEWTSRAMEFEKAWEGSLQDLAEPANTSAPELEHVRRPTHAVDEEPSTERRF
ncbi:hypothetical protein RB195_006014 [Necator americanus]|uniref:Uncharacterized protein n=1 Tax=Necator americanus TaxID=51031 RepID=A0ABR1BQN3_NECAM